MNSQNRDKFSENKQRADIIDIEQQVEGLYAQANELAQQALTQKMFNGVQADLINDTQQQKPEYLFASTEQRPLVVAFFGGTGVGKSTLLNRFAGETIARTGVERPTSREVTIFLHQSVEVKQLPEDFPIGKVNIRQHQDQDKRDILWIDMPDIDSVETENLAIVKDWLPYIDVLLYVVSPERYRDDRGWQFLLEQGYKHAWLFVINQWKLAGQVVQSANTVIEDFTELLRRAGFEHPLIYRSDCLADDVEDDFELLSENLFEIANDHTITELDRRGIWNRLQHLQSVLKTQIKILGDSTGFDQMEMQFRQSWDRASLDIQHHLQLTIQKQATNYARRPSSFSLMPWKRSKSLKEDEQVLEVNPTNQAIWDQRAESIVDASLDRLLLEADNHNLPINQLQARIEELKPQINKRMEQSLQTGLQQGLINPGNRLHRFVHSLLGILTTLMPVAALAWVAYRVISGFYVGNNSEYFGANFAIHSSLLVLVAWLIPYLLHKKSRPSIQKAAQKGMEHGLAEGLAEFEAEVNSHITKCKQLQSDLINKGLALLQTSKTIKPIRKAVESPILQRMLQKKVAH